MSKNGLKENVAIVTGSARGIGAAIAKRLAADGAAVVVNYSSSVAAAKETVALILKAGGRALAVQADVSDAAAVSRLYKEATDAFGPITVLVNNAGVSDPRPLEAVDTAYFEKLFHTNVLGTLLMTAEFARRYQGPVGRVVNISSGGARSAMPGGSVYCASKAAVEGLTRGHALELGSRGVTVNSVAPGITETEMMRNGLPEEIKNQMIANTSLGRLGEPDDIADVVAFLCSKDGRWVTGQFLDVNGGLRF